MFYESQLRGKEVKQSETRECKQCSKLMIPRPDCMNLGSSPIEQGWYWWCRCGWNENGGIQMSGELEEVFHENIWNKANGIDKDSPARLWNWYKYGM